MRRVVLIPLNKGKGIYTIEDNYFIVSDHKEVNYNLQSVTTGEGNNRTNNNIIVTDEIYESSLEFGIVKAKDDSGKQIALIVEGASVESPGTCIEVSNSGDRVWLVFPPSSGDKEFILPVNEIGGQKTLATREFVENILEIALPFPKISHTPSSSLTGVNVLTPLLHFEIPPLTGCNKLNIDIRGLKASATGTSVLRFFIHTTNDFSSNDKVQIAQSNLTTVQSFYMDRSFDVLATTLEGYRFDASVASDKNVANTGRNSTPYTKANPLHFWVAISPHSTDEVHSPKSAIIEPIKEQNEF